MGSNSLQQKQALTQLLRDAVLELFATHKLYGGPLEVDGIICITGQSEGQELVVKLHEKLQQHQPQSLVVTAPLPSPPVSNHYHEESVNSTSNMGLCLKISPDGRSSDVAMAPESDDEHSASRDSEQDVLELSTHNTSMSNSTQMDCDDKMDKNSDDSPPGSEGAGIGPKGMYLGKLPFLSSAAYQQKKLPLRSDRWTPNTPLPSTPECKHCGYTFANYEVLSEHNEAVHSVFTCPYCFKTFTSRSNLERHSRLHTGHRPYVCSLCGKAFSRKDHLTNHSTKHAFKCATCLKRFADKKQLGQHYNIDHNSSLSQVCEFCNKGFPTMGSYEDHIKTHPQYHATRKGRRSPGSVASTGTSGGIKRLLCRLCSFSCNDRITLMKHKMVHSESQRCFTCLACAKMFGNPLEYSNHLFTHTSESNIFECCICRQLCSSLDSLKKHELIHLNEPILASGQLDAGLQFFSCPQCDKTFQSVTNLQEHMEIHESVNKFKCPICSQGFPSYTDLWKHTEDLKHYTAVQANTDADNNYMPQPYAGNVEQQPNNYSKKLREIQHMDDSDIEIVEPQAPEDLREEQNGGPAYNEEYVVTENPTPVIEIARQEKMLIKMDPVRSMLSRTAPRKQERPQKVRDNYTEPLRRMLQITTEIPSENDMPQDLSQKSSNRQAKQASPERPPENMPSPALTPKRNREIAADMATEGAPEMARDKSPVTPDIIPEKAPDIPITPEGKTLENAQQSNSETTINPEAPAVPEYIEITPSTGDKTSDANPDTPTPVLDVKPMLVTEPPIGPFTCSVCSAQSFDTFLDLETHCFSKHSRSPCMYCPKTFAQKANRDRHTCLHTGEKPYSCPDCSEKFSRGDKLKIHRTKVHNISYPPNSRVRDGSSKDWSLSSSPSPLVDRSSVSPSPAGGTSSVSSGDISRMEEWNGSATETVHATGEWTVRVEATEASPKPQAVVPKGVTTRSQSTHLISSETQ